MYAIAALLGRIDSHDKKNHSTEPVPNASRLKWEARQTEMIALAVGLGSDWKRAYLRVSLLNIAVNCCFV